MAQGSPVTGKATAPTHFALCFRTFCQLKQKLQVYSQSTERVTIDKVTGNLHLICIKCCSWQTKSPYQKKLADFCIDHVTLDGTDSPSTRIGWKCVERKSGNGPNWTTNAERLRAPVGAHSRRLVIFCCFPLVLLVCCIHFVRHHQKKNVSDDQLIGLRLAPTVGARIFKRTELRPFHPLGQWSRSVVDLIVCLLDSFDSPHLPLSRGFVKLGKWAVKLSCREYAS